MTTIIYAHPYSGSFNHAVLDLTVETLNKKGEQVCVIDLYEDGFNPALEADSLRLYSQGESADPIVKRYVDVLLGTEKVIMIFPVWWGMFPAIVKGFFDKVMLTGTAYRYDTDGELIPAEINVRRTVLLTTSQSDTGLFRPFFEDYLPNHILKAVGFNNPEWHNCDQTAHGPDENRKKFLQTVTTVV